MPESTFPTFATPVPFADTPVGGGCLCWDHNFPLNGMFWGIKTAQADTVYRPQDGALVTVPAAQVVIPYPAVVAAA